MSDDKPLPSLPPDERESMPLSEIREGTLNVKNRRSGRKAIVVRTGSDVRVFGELCPHMGADMAEATYCAKTGTLHCRWHGYVFSAKDGKFLENPNEKLMGILRTPSKHYDPTKMPRYRLSVIPSTVKEGRVFFGREEEASAAMEGGEA